MGVDIPGDGNAAVPQPLGDDLQVDALRQHQRGMSMPQVMKSQTIKPRLPGSPPEGVGHRDGIQRFSAGMDREGYILPQERATWEPEEIEQTLGRLADVVNSAQRGEVMDRPYPQSSTECRYCNYHTECWGTDPDQEALAGKQTVTSEQKEVVEAARTWRDLKPQVDKARDMLQALSNSNGQADVLVDGIIGGYFQPKSERVYDPEALERAVPADILERCRINLREKPPAFWVRRERN